MCFFLRRTSKHANHSNWIDGHSSIQDIWRIQTNEDHFILFVNSVRRYFMIICILYRFSIFRAIVEIFYPPTPSSYEKFRFQKQSPKNLSKILLFCHSTFQSLILYIFLHDYACCCFVHIQFAQIIIMST